MQQEDIEALSMSELDKLLQEELSRDDTDAELVRQIAKVIGGRDKNASAEVSSEVQALVERFVHHGQREPTHRNWAPRVAAALIAVVIAATFMLTVLPIGAKAGNWWDRIAQWTGEMFEFISHGNVSKKYQEYAFRTDNPGLQEVYDAIVDLGVTDPVVPMWLPEGYILEEIRQIQLKTKTLEYARFVYGDKYITYKAYVYSVEDGCGYNIDEKNAAEYENAGITHYIMQNKDKCVAVWTKKNIECSLTIEGPEELMCEVLASIYTERR